MFNLHCISIKPKAVCLSISVILLTTLTSGCALFCQEDKDDMRYRSAASNMMMIKLPSEISTTIYQTLNRETPENAIAKQPHTMGDTISGKIICDNEFVDGAPNATEQTCRVIVDTTNRGVGG